MPTKPKFTEAPITEHRSFTLDLGEIQRTEGTMQHFMQILYSLNDFSEQLLKFYNEVQANDWTIGWVEAGDSGYDDRCYSSSHDRTIHISTSFTRPPTTAEIEEQKISFDQRQKGIEEQKAKAKSAADEALFKTVKRNKTKVKKILEELDG